MKNPHDLEETAVSTGRKSVDEPGGVDARGATEPDFGATPPGEEGTGVSSPTDVTMVRTTPSASTVTDLSDPNNFGKYELLGEIARGGMGVVYRARQRGLDRLVALKMILGSGVSHESAQRFLQEARAAAALDHPNVVPIYDIGEIGDKPYFTMALVDGPNLRGFVDANGKPAISAVVSVFAQIVAGVAHAHRHGIIHRDLKPANVLMDKDGRPRVTDFGLAKRTATDTALTATGQVVGTPQYMAPEQARESKDVGPPADVYSLGAILYFLLVGRAPFHGESLTDLLIKVVSEQPEPPRTVRPDTPEELEALCLRCLAKTPQERFADADALLAALAPIHDRHRSSSAPSLGSLGPTGSKTTPSLPSANSVPSFSTEPNVGDLVGTNSGPTFPSSLSSPRAAEPRANANRKFVVFGLGTLAVALIAVVAFLALRDKKPQEVAKENPPPSNGSPETPPGPPPIEKGADKFAWPAPTNNDFGLKVELNAPGKQNKDGKVLLHAGSPMSLRLTADKDCRVAVWLLDSTGHEEKLFPNDDETDDRVFAGKERVIPGNNAYVLETTPTEGPSADRIRVIATTGAPIAYPPGAKNGRFTFYTNDADREKLASTVRGVVHKKTNAGADSPGAITEREIQFRVQK